MSPPPSFSPPYSNNDKIENVLVLQGGGSLGAFGCGVIKGLAKNNIKLDIIAGTSIGGINAAIIAGSKDEKHPERLLEQFWLELSDSFIDMEKSPFGFHPQFVEQTLSPHPFNPLLLTITTIRNQRKSLNSNRQKTSSKN